MARLEMLALFDAWQKSALRVRLRPRGPEEAVISITGPGIDDNLDLEMRARPSDARGAGRHACREDHREGRPTRQGTPAQASYGPRGRLKGAPAGRSITRPGFCPPRSDRHRFRRPARRPAGPKAHPPRPDSFEPAQPVTVGVVDYPEYAHLNRAEIQTKKHVQKRT